MGLSNEERIRNIIDCVDALTDIEPFILDANDSKPQQVNDILKDLWHDLFGAESNSVHWFAGSSSDNSTVKQADAFGLAMIHSYESGLDSKQNYYAEADTAVGPGTKEWFEYTDLYRPNALSLLKHHHGYNNRRNQAHDVLAIFKYIENYFYNINRYDDNLSKSFSSLTNKISQLKGFCYKIMSKDDIFWKAYASGIVFERILTVHLDDVNKWFKDNHMHHNVRFDRIERADLFNALSLAQKSSQFSSNERLVLILKFCGYSFYHKFEHEKLFKVIDKHNKEFEKDKINLNQIKKLCKKAFNDHELKDKENLKNNHWSCDLTGESNYSNDKRYQKMIKANRPKKAKKV